MTSLEGVNNQITVWTQHIRDKEITTWSTSPHQLVRNGKDTVMDVTYTIKNMQTPPVAVLVQPNSPPHIQTPPILESRFTFGVDKKRVNWSHVDNMTSIANPQAAEQNGLQVLPSGSTYTRTLKHDIGLATVNNELRSIHLIPTSQVATQEPDSPKPSESRYTLSLQHLTTAEAATQALNAAFQTQGEGINARPSHKGFLADSTATDPNEVPQNEDGLRSADKTNDTLRQSSVQPSPKRPSEKEKSPKKYVFEAVVIDDRPPHLTGLVSPKRHVPQVKLRDTADKFIKTGPPKARDRRPIRILRTEAEVEHYLQSSIAPVRFATKAELAAAEDATYTNVEILTAHWESRPLAESSPVIPSIIYPTSQPLERFVDGIESAFGPGALSRIPSKRPKRVLTQQNYAKYLYTSSDPEETEAEQVSDFPADEDELVIEDTTTTMRAGINSGMNGPGTLKRKLSASDHEDSRKHPRLQEDVPGTKSHRPGIWKIDKDVIEKWVTSLEVLVKGKVKLGRQELRKLRQILDHVYNLKNSLSVDDPSLSSEVSILRSRIRQLSEMTADDIPFNDDEKLRQKARMISRSWIS